MDSKVGISCTAVMTIPRSGHFYRIKSDHETDLEIHIGLMLDGILSEEGIDDHVQPTHGSSTTFDHPSS